MGKTRKQNDEDAKRRREEDEKRRQKRRRELDLVNTSIGSELWDEAWGGANGGW